MEQAPVATAIAPATADARAIAWVRANLFGTLGSTLTTVLLAGVAILFAAKLLNWALVNAVWWTAPGDSAACRAVQGKGACWALIGEKYRFALFATYPYDQQWRPALACLILISLYAISSSRRFWSRRLLLMWAAGLALFALLMRGGAFGLSFVTTEAWGGLPVTLLLATFAIGLALPLGVLLALGRRAASLPVIRAMCVGYIELVRGLPLVSLLFMASFLLPLFLPTGMSVDKLLRAQVALILFAAAYLAEVARGGLQSVARGQFEAADALGLGYWRAHWLIVLPQALRDTIPAIVNTSIAMLKNTSLVLIIGLFDLLSAAKATIVDPRWQGFGLEMYIAVSCVYFVFCFSMSRYSLRLERALSCERNA